ncbi:hypothetical protein CPAR01_01614 [Colletotrichum paranaense]|uniref:Uncharacterized protein n=1 Tax=Colletotrichum paranaense TaxID=1914294 RepID=A0ABQ9T793_9PEZI|nr:uncharacterized protein CPAR01_01614 [Colletotrichum paranaense]KAK1547647.1 hypothetical protein CPAR01_01614 [Colletotrichum paranaense]
METRSQRNKGSTWNRHMRGKESLWYFGTENFRAISFVARDYFGPQVKLDESIVFVSIKTVLSLGSPISHKQNWQNTDNGANYQKEQVFAWADEELLNEAPTDWRLPDEKKATGIQLSVRLSNGNAIELPILVKTYPKTPNNWTKYVRRVLSLGSGNSFKPTRQCDMPLERPLLVKPLEKRLNLIHQRSYQTLNNFFRGLIKTANTVNEQSRMTTGNRNRDYGKWKLMLYDDSPPHLAHQYMKMSEADPFELYSTWIHEDDWHSYMTMLAETETNPIRRFISLNNAGVYKTLDDLLIKVGSRDLEIQAGLSREERKEYGLDPNQAEFDKASVEELGPRKVSEVIRKRRLQGIKSYNKTYRFENGQAIIEADLSVAKMDAACGMRPSQPTQAAVMGGFSASNIAQGLGWEKSRLASGFYSSEVMATSMCILLWRVHASWCKIWVLNQPELGEFDIWNFRDQLPHDKVLSYCQPRTTHMGLSVANALTDPFAMYRYEMAWQNLCREEQKIENEEAKRQGRKPRSLKGQVSIHCNNFSKPIRYDCYGLDNKYKFEDFTIPREFVKKAVQMAMDNQGSENPQLMCAGYAANNATTRLVQDTREREDAASIEEMLALAHDFPFVVYSMEYKIQIGFPSNILQEDRTTASFTFYPFQRSLYHQAEAILDVLLWEKLKENPSSLLNVDFSEEDAVPSGEDSGSIVENAMARIIEEDLEEPCLQKSRLEAIKDKRRRSRKENLYSDTKKHLFKILKNQDPSQQLGGPSHIGNRNSGLVKERAFP